jgi:ribosomal protein S18 acetylase RimI-like enzyme
VVGEGGDGADHPQASVILREATDADAEAIEALDLGRVSTPTSDEVREILTGLMRWQRDIDHAVLDRQVVVAELDGQIAAVAAYEYSINERTSEPYAGYRYLMVVAFDAPLQRSGIARALLESVFTEMAKEGVTTVSWLVAPSNKESLAFTHNVFPEADETQGPDGRPYLRFTLSL